MFYVFQHKHMFKKDLWTDDWFIALRDLLVP
jgi:hypothetical protein